jgi:hypothetical protein
MNFLSGFKNCYEALFVVICSVLALAIGVIRYLTGPEWALSAFYLFPIILVTWKAGYAESSLQYINIESAS